MPQSFVSRCNRRSAALTFAALAAAVSPITVSHAQGWTGAAATGNWSDGANWDSGVPVSGEATNLFFAAAAPIKNSVNDLSGVFTFNILTFESGGFTLSGSALRVGGAFHRIVHQAAGDNRINNDLILDKTLTMNLSTSGRLLLNGVLSGSGGIAFFDPGTLVLSNANTFTGMTIVNDGTLRLENALALQNSTLNLNPQSRIEFATLTQATVGNLDGTGGTHSLTNALAQAVALTVGGNNQDTWDNASFSGSGSLTKVGTGTLRLTGSHAYTGGLTVAQGTVLHGINAALEETAVSVGAGGTLGFSAGGGSFRIGSLAGTGTVNLTNVDGVGTDAVVGYLNTDSTFDGVLTGIGSLNKFGTGTLTLTGANTHTGNTTATFGKLRIGNATTLQNSNVRLGGSDAISFAAGVTQATFGNLTGFSTSDTFALQTETGQPVTLTVGGNNAPVSTFFGSLTGGGTLIKVGTGVLEISGSQANTGGVIVTQGQLRGATTTFASVPVALNTDSAAPQALDLSLSGFQQFGSLSGTSNLTLTRDGTSAVTLAVGYNNASTTYSGVLSGLGGISKNGTGTFTLARANTFSGFTVVNAGKLRLGNTLSLQNSTISYSTSYANPLDFGTLTAATIGGFTGVGNQILNNSDVNPFGVQLSFGADNTNQNVPVAFSGGGGLTKNGTGSLSFSNNQLYSGPTNVNGGTFLVNQFAPSLSIVLLNAGSAINFGTRTAVTFGGFGGAANATLTNQNGQAVTLTADRDFQSTDYSGAFSGAGTFVKDGTGTMTISGKHFNAGGFVVEDGVVHLAAADALEDVPVSIRKTFQAGFPQFPLKNGTLTFGAFSGVRLKTFSGSGDLALGTSSNTPLTLTVGGGNGDADYSGVFYGSGSLVKEGTGTFSLFGTNTFTGTTTVTGGVLRLWNGSALSGSTVILPAPGGAIDFQTITAATLGNIAGANDFALRNSAAGNLTLTVGGNGSSSTYSGVLSGGGALIKTGAGTLTLARANTYTSLTSINGGRVRLGDINSVANSTVSINVANGINFGTLRQATFGGLSGGSTQVLSNESNATVELTVGGNNASTTLFGALSGNGSLRKTGTGTLRMGGANTFVGPTNVLAGALLINGGLERSSINTVADGALFGGFGAVGNVSVASGGTISPGDRAFRQNDQQSQIGTFTATSLLVVPGTNFLFDLGNGINDQIFADSNMTFSGNGEYFFGFRSENMVVGSTYRLIRYPSTTAGGNYTPVNHRLLASSADPAFVIAGSFGEITEGGQDYLTFSPSSFQPVPVSPFWVSVPTGIVALALSSRKKLGRRRRQQ